MSHSSSIVVCSHNGSGRIEPLLESLRRLTGTEGGGVELIMVDSASTDDTAEILRRCRLPFECRAVRTQKPGHSRALNLGVKVACGDLVLFTDDDCQVHDQWLVAYKEAYERNPSAAYFCGRIVPIMGAPAPLWWGLAPRSLSGREEGREPAILRTPDPRSYPIGCNMAVPRRLFDRDLFDERLGPSPGSRLGLGADVELGLRFLSRGAHGVWVPGAVVRHYVGPERVKWTYILERARRSGRSRVYYQRYGLPRAIVSMLELASGACADVVLGVLKRDPILLRRASLRLAKALGVAEETLVQ